MNKRGRLVIIDSDAAMLNMLSEFFSTQGFLTHCFRATTMAVQFLESEIEGTCDLILADLGSSATMVSESLDRLSQLSKVPILLMSSFANQELGLPSSRQGVGLILKKPFSLSSMAKAVERHLIPPNHKKVL